MAKEEGVAGGSAPCGFTAANEEAVDAFVLGNMQFLRIVGLIEDVLTEHEVIEPKTMDDVTEVETWARARARQILGAQ